MAKRKYINLSLLFRTGPAEIYDSFVEPKLLSKFWLKRSSAPLQVGVPVKWDFMVSGASETVTGKRLVPGELISFSWSDGVKVTIKIASSSRSLSVVRIAAGPFGSTTKAVDAAEGFSVVLCDLKVLLETGKSPGLVKDKARLISG